MGARFSRPKEADYAAAFVVDACVRGAESRSRMLAERFLSSYAAANPDTAILHRDLMRDRLEPQYPEVLARRDALAAAGKLDDPLFADAWQFARADRIVLAAPFWELSFPAILRIYLERVSMRDITFGYKESGLVGRCRARVHALVVQPLGAEQLKFRDAEHGAQRLELARRGRPRADLAGLRHRLAVGQADGHAREEGIARAGGVLHVHLLGGAPALLTVVRGIHRALRTHRHHHARDLCAADARGEEPLHLLRRLVVVILGEKDARLLLVADKTVRRAEEVAPLHRDAHV